MLRCSLFLLLLAAPGPAVSRLRAPAGRGPVLPQDRGFYTVQARPGGGGGGAAAAPALPAAAAAAAAVPAPHRGRRSAAEAAALPKVYGQVNVAHPGGRGRARAR